MLLNQEYIARLFSYLLLKYTSFQACIIYTLNATKPDSLYRYRFLFRHGTIRQYLSVLLGTRFQSHSKQRSKENRTTTGPTRAVSAHGVTPPYHLPKHTATLPTGTGAMVLSLPLPLTEPDLNATMLCTEVRKQLETITHLHVVSYSKAQAMSSLGPHTFTPLATSRISSQNIPGHYFQTDQLLSNPFSTEMQTALLSAKPNANSCKGNPAMPPLRSLGGVRKITRGPGCTQGHLHTGLGKLPVLWDVLCYDGMALLKSLFYIAYQFISKYTHMCM